MTLGSSELHPVGLDQNVFREEGRLRLDFYLLNHTVI